MSVGDQRTLAARLAELDDATLVALLQARGIPADAPWHDMFDAAIALLEPASVERALRTLTRDDLVALSAGSATEAIRRLGIVGEDGAPFDAVSAALDAARDTRPDAFTPPPLPDTADAPDESVLAERAFTATAALGEVLAAVPLERTAGGALTAPERRRLAETTGMEETEVDDAVAVAVACDLLADDGSRWLASDAAQGWLDQETAVRWRAVATQLLDAAPPESALGVEAWTARRPLDPAWPETVSTLHRRMARWGVLGDAGGEPAWTRFLRTGDEDAARTAFARHLPAEIDRVYLQADLTAVAPGALRAPLERRLRRAATRESHAQASTYRFSEMSVTRAVAAGETAESLRTFLAELSLTGVPQPLDYLISRTAARHGLLRVRDDDGRARIASTDAHLLETVRVDHSLRALGLFADADELESRVSADTVYFALLDARYPVVALDAEGSPAHPVRARSRPREAAAGPAASAYAPLIEALRASSGTDAETAWRERELSRAVRERTNLRVTVDTGGGVTREFVLEATGIGGGRFRGRDRTADVERTIPVSWILSAVPAD